MGTRGPVRQSRDLQAVKGNPRKQKQGPPPAKLEAGVPVMPKTLSKEAKKQWEELSPALVAAGLLTPLDGVLFAELCEAGGRVAELRAYIKRYGRHIQNRNRTKTLRSEVKELREELKQYQKLSDLFCLTPTARARLNVVVKQPRTADDDRSREKFSILHPGA
jgi:P27 family predicted phage terminase small subunit